MVFSARQDDDDDDGAAAASAASAAGAAAAVAIIVPSVSFAFALLSSLQAFRFIPRPSSKSIQDGNLY